MHRNLENQYRTLYNDHKILTVLGESEPFGFRQIHRQAGGSQRTLWKHLKALHRRRAVRKIRGKYLITDAGLAFIGRLERQVKLFEQYKKDASYPSSRSYLQDYAVDITRIHASGHVCIGTFKVSLPGMLQPERRQELDKTLTQVVRIISSAIPKDVKEYEVTIAGTLSRCN